MNTGKIYANTLRDILEKVDTGSKSSDVSGLMDSIISIAIPLAAVSVTILLVFSAYKLMTSGGNPDKLREGKDMITNAIIGFLFVLMSISILLLLANLFNINLSR